MMDEYDKQQLYRAAWKHWGAEAQIDMIIEEMAELTQALLKTRRNGVVFSAAVFEEMADVSICFEQLLMEIEHLEKPKDFYKHKEQKLLRLKERLMKSMAEKHEGCGDCCE